MFYCMFYFSCDRSLIATYQDGHAVQFSAETSGGGRGVGNRGVVCFRDVNGGNRDTQHGTCDLNKTTSATYM